MFKEFLNNKARIIETTDPDRIYIENVRSFFNISTRFAKLLCDFAVNQGSFEKKIAIECINKNCKRVIKVVGSIEQLPDKVSCDICEIEGEEKFIFHKDEYKVIEYYRLKKNEY